MANWYCNINGTNYGPAYIDTMLQWIRDGRIIPGTLVWNETMSNWLPARDVAELSAALGQIDHTQAPCPEDTEIKPKMSLSEILKLGWKRKRFWKTLGCFLLLYLLLAAALAPLFMIAMIPVGLIATTDSAGGAEAPAPPPGGAFLLLIFIPMLFVMPAIMVGVTRFFLQQARGQTARFTTLLSGFKPFWSTFRPGIIVLIGGVLVTAPNFIANYVQFGRWSGPSPEQLKNLPLPAFQTHVLYDNPLAITLLVIGLVTTMLYMCFQSMAWAVISNRQKDTALGKSLSKAWAITKNNFPRLLAISAIYSLVSIGLVLLAFLLNYLNLAAGITAVVVYYISLLVISIWLAVSFLVLYLHVLKKDENPQIEDTETLNILQ